MNIVDVIWHVYNLIFYFMRYVSLSSAGTLIGGLPML